MAYSKTVWKARQGTNLNKFTKSQETSGSVILTNAPDSVTEPGTPFSAENMNHIEEGIAEAHSRVTNLETKIVRFFAPGSFTAVASTTQPKTQISWTADEDCFIKIQNEGSSSTIIYYSYVFGELVETVYLNITGYRNNCVGWFPVPKGMLIMAVKNEAADTTTNLSIIKRKLNGV